MLHQFFVYRMASRLCACLTLLACATFALAQPNEQNPPNRLIPSHLVRFELILGRLQLSPEYFRIGTAHDRMILADGRERVRSLAVSVMSGKPTLQFQDRGGDATWNVTFKSEHVVDIVFCSSTRPDGQTLAYHQPAKGPIVVTVEYGDGRPARRLEARSLWHMAMEEADFFEAHLQPLLERLEPSWGATQIVSETRGLLNNTVHRSELEEIDSLVRSLDATSAAERYAATVRLERMGLLAELQLRARLQAELTPQQRLAVEKLLTSMQPVGNDNPVRLAVWLANDFKGVD